MKLKKIVADKSAKDSWDRGIENESQNLLSVLLYEYSSSIESLTNGRIKAIDVVNKIAGDPVTSEKYKIATRVEENFGAHAPTYVDSDGKTKCAVVLF